MKQTREIITFPNANELFKAAAYDFMQRSIEAVRERGIFSVVLSGGETPKLFFNELVNLDNIKKEIPWNKIQFFFGDERYVSRESKESNYYTAFHYLFSKVPVDFKNIYPIATDFNNPNDAAQQYDHLLKTILPANKNDYALFDLIYLGLGDDAHTASLMPFSDIVSNGANDAISNDNMPLVVSLWVQKLNMYRITLTPFAINNSNNIIFLVTGANKANALKQVLEGPYEPKRYPAQLIECVNGKTIWYLEQSAVPTIE